MATMDTERARDLLQAFDFDNLFIDQLGWSRPGQRAPFPVVAGTASVQCRPVAELGGALVVQADNGAKIPPAADRAALAKAVAQKAHEHVLIFVDGARTQSLWCWMKREGAKTYPREHLYVKGQPGDLFLSKISALFFDLSDFDEHGNVSIVSVANRLRDALDVERVTKRFYRDFETERLAFTDLITGIDNDRDRRWYASILLNRLMFIWFLQRKGLVDNGRTNYLAEKVAAVGRSVGAGTYYRSFLLPLFFEGFAKPEAERTAEARRLLGHIVYLNGGLFLPHRIEEEYPHIQVPDAAFENLYALFQRYSWNLDDTPGGKDDEISPHVLGYIFEKYINQKAFGAYYTRPEITEYLCEQTIHRLILDRVNPSESLALPGARRYDNLADLLMGMDAAVCHRMLNDILPNLTLLDPACGSGAFLVAAMKTLLSIYGAVTGRIEALGDAKLLAQVKGIRDTHPSLNYYIKRQIVTNNLFGVDIVEEACEIAKLRLFLALVSSARAERDLEPLPNIDFNIVPGNSLIGLMRADDKDFNARHAQGTFFRKSYREVLDEKNRLIATYRSASTYSRDLRALRDHIAEKKAEAAATLDSILLDELTKLGIRFEQATWDDTKGKTGKPQRRRLTVSDIRALTPFHWGFEFDEVLNGRGGFDAIITNPPWEIFKPQAKEFFQEYSDVVTKNKMTIEEFDKEQSRLLTDPDVKIAWLAYLSRFPHVSAFFRSAPQYANQIAVVNGKKAGSDINLFKLFTEQCANLLRPGGEMGIVIPSGIYTDLGTKQLREMLFGQGLVTGLFGFENRKAIFEDVHRMFKFVVLTWRKGGSTAEFPAAYMRHDVAELADFPRRGGLTCSVDLARRLSPDSLSLMEFRCEMDARIAEKMLRFPLLGEHIEGAWNLKLCNEFHMTNDKRLFRTEPGPGRLPLYEGKMIHQFTHTLRKPRYWVDEAEGRKALLGRTPDAGQTVNYERYRLAHRSIASNTNERTMVATAIPHDVFYGHSLNADTGVLHYSDMLFSVALLNSFVVDAALRVRVTTNLTMFYVYQVPVPRLTQKDAAFAPLVERAARLVCTTHEFDDLAREVGLRDHRDGATDPAERARLRAEIDGLVAHLYGLTEDEFNHVLSTFPLVPEPTIVAARNAYRDVAAGVVR